MTLPQIAYYSMPDGSERPKGLTYGQVMDAVRERRAWLIAQGRLKPRE